jgi:hypothetical protein
LTERSEFIGQWFFEIALQCPLKSEAIAMRSLLLILCDIEPDLWRTCGKAEAALSLFIAASPQ